MKGLAISSDLIVFRFVKANHHLLCHFYFYGATINLFNLLIFLVVEEKV